jgi:hypothetical protein
LKFALLLLAAIFAFTIADSDFCDSLQGSGGSMIKVQLNG